MTDTKVTPKVTATADVTKAGQVGQPNTPTSTGGPAPEDGKKVVENTNSETSNPTGSPKSTVEPPPPVPPHDDAGVGSEVSAADQKLIDEAMGDDAENDFDDDTPKPAETRAKAESALKQFRKVAAGIPHTTPDDHPLWGNANGSIKVGDLRALLSALPNRD